MWIPDVTNTPFAVLFDPYNDVAPAQGVKDENPIAEVIQRHYRAKKRWSRYETYRMWLVIDLYSSLYATNWNERYDELAKQVEKDVSTFNILIYLVVILTLNACLSKRETKL